MVCLDERSKRGCQDGNDILTCDSLHIYELDCFTLDSLLDHHLLNTISSSIVEGFIGVLRATSRGRVTRDYFFARMPFLQCSPI